MTNGTLSPAMKARDTIEDLILTRYRHGITQRTAARIIGVSVWTLRSWESRTRAPAPETRTVLELWIAAQNSLPKGGEHAVSKCKKKGEKR